LHADRISLFRICGRYRCGLLRDCGSPGDAIRDPSGALIGFAEITRDITERRQAQEELKASERQFRLLVQGVTDYAIFMLDPNGIITSWNAGAVRIKGYTAGEIIGQHFSRFYSAVSQRLTRPVGGICDGHILGGHAYNAAWDDMEMAYCHWASDGCARARFS